MYIYMYLQCSSYARLPRGITIVPAHLGAAAVAAAVACNLISGPQPQRLTALCQPPPAAAPPPGKAAHNLAHLSLCGLADIPMNFYLPAEMPTAAIAATAATIWSLSPSGVLSCFTAHKYVSHAHTHTLARKRTLTI